MFSFLVEKENTDMTSLPFLSKQSSYGFYRQRVFPGTSNGGVPQLTGPQGPIGLRGNTSTGSQGAQGNNGNAGNAGVQGGQGSRGVQGIQGNTGTQGSNGVVGSNGPVGFQGIVGSTGVTGTQGNIGTTGAQGSQGVQGLQGTQGGVGSTGLQGTSTVGTVGLVGSQGFIGATGLQGSQGPAGLFTGTTGSTGPNGFIGPISRFLRTNYFSSTSGVPLFNFFVTEYTYSAVTPGDKLVSFSFTVDCASVVSTTMDIRLLVDSVEISPVYTFTIADRIASSLNSGYVQWYVPNGFSILEIQTRAVLGSTVQLVNMDAFVNGLT